MQGLTLGLRKCAVANVIRGKLQEGGALPLSDDRTIPAASNDEKLFLQILKDCGLKIV